MKIKTDEKKIRLAIFSTGEIFGGVEQFILRYVEEIKERTDIQCFVVLFNEGRLYEELVKIGASVIFLKPRFKYDLGIILRIASLLRELNINIAHTHGYKANILAGVAANICKIRLIKTEHGKLERGHGWEYFKMVFNTIIDRYIAGSLFDFVVFVSGDLRNEYGWKRKKTECAIIHNGIKPIVSHKFDRELKVGGDIFNIGMIGRIDHVKGHIHLLRALRIIKNPQMIQIYILGSGPLEERLKRFCAINQLANVQFMGFKDNALEYLKQLDLIAIPSIHEGLPYILLESMYLKVPILASNVGGMKEILENGMDALLVPPGDERELAKGIDYLYDHPEIRESMASNAYKKVLRDYMIDQMFLKYKNVYGKMLAE